MITFGPHGVTGNPDHIVVGSATRWAVERLAETGHGADAVYVVSPVFAPGTQALRPSAEEAGRHATGSTSPRSRAASSRPSSATPARPDAKQELADLRAQLEADGVIYEGYTRVRPLVPAPHPEFDARLL